MIFIIEMQGKWFYYKNALEMIFTLKCIGNDFCSKNALENDLYY